MDLDGTLIHSDLLVETALALLASRPWLIFSMLVWLLRGRAYLKQQIARRVTFDAESLPYNRELIAWLRQQRASREVLLCTASDTVLAEKVVEHTQCFDGLFASDGVTNLSGRHKAQALVDAYGEQGFDYVGNAMVDLRVWKHARAAIVIERGTKLSTLAAKFCTVERRFEHKAGGIRAWIHALRLHQWIKNVLVFLPILAAHRILDPESVILTALAFLCFGLCASSVYLVNDLLDLPADRKHHRKRHRPFASGELPLLAGLPVAALLLVAGFGLALIVSRPFVGALLGYFILTTAYSLKLKRVVMLDVIVLATLYTSRIVAGAAALHTKPSFWLLAFSMFIFLSLAMIKRFVELRTLLKGGKGKASGRGYDVEDISLIQSMGASSGYLAVLVLALYIDSTASELLYSHPHYLWLLCPLMLYWISRAWAIAHRDLMHDDPVVFALKDRTSRVLLLLAAIIALAAI
ncbi:UbiA family prenyltransferase [Dyella amyloliquefaciens]|uniref:UbiA family prenyltransferase n=1 Tax=Dyella amyloliquefaciens TaxID=1770545 RepID=UPI001E5D1D3B